MAVKTKEDIAVEQAIKTCYTSINAAMHEVDKLFRNLDRSTYASYESIANRMSEGLGKAHVAATNLVQRLKY